MYVCDLCLRQRDWRSSCRRDWAWAGLFPTFLSTIPWYACAATAIILHMMCTIFCHTDPSIHPSTFTFTSHPRQRNACLCQTHSLALSPTHPLALSKRYPHRLPQVKRAGIAVNVDMDIARLTPGGGSRGPGTDPSLLSRVQGLSIVNLTAMDAIGCGREVTDGVYCGGAGCLRGNELAQISGVVLDNISISSSAESPSRRVLGWACVNASVVKSDRVVPTVCEMPPGSRPFACSET